MIPMRAVGLLLLLAGLPGLVPAQSFPGVELASGFSFSRIPAESEGLTAAGLNGWEASVKLWFRPRLGWVFDFSGGYGERRMLPTRFQPRETFPGAVRQYTMLLGPEVKLFTSGRFTAQARALIGALYIARLDLPLKEPFVPGPPDPRPLVTEFNLGFSKPLAVALGGSLDYRLTDHVSLRLVQPELVVSHLGTVAPNLHRLRISTGVVFTFGG